MNASHARPLVAFGCLVVLASAILSSGLRDEPADDRSATSTLESGDRLRPVTEPAPEGQLLDGPGAPFTSLWTSAAALEHEVNQLILRLSDDAPTAVVPARTTATGVGGGSTSTAGSTPVRSTRPGATSTRPKARPTRPAPAVSLAAPGKSEGKGNAKGHGSGTGHGKAKGKSKG